MSAEVTCFKCRITSNTGIKSVINIELPKYIQKGNSVFYKDEFGNKFRYDTIEFRGKSYKPEIPFDMFNNPKYLNAFHYITPIAYHNIIDSISFELQSEFQLKQEKEHEEFFNLSKLIRVMKKTHSLYFPIFEEIYTKNLQKNVDITDDERKYVEEFKKPFKITRFTVYLIMLFRYNFILKYNLKNEDFILSTWKDFYDAFNHRNRKKKRKSSHKNT